MKRQRPLLRSFDQTIILIIHQGRHQTSAVMPMTFKWRVSAACVQLEELWPAPGSRDRSNHSIPRGGRSVARQRHSNADPYSQARVTAATVRNERKAFRRWLY